MATEIKLETPRQDAVLRLIDLSNAYMASLYPAEAMGLTGERGRIAPGLRADLVHLSDDLAVRGTLIGGETAWAA